MSAPYQPQFEQHSASPMQQQGTSQQYGSHVAQSVFAVVPQPMQQAVTYSMQQAVTYPMQQAVPYPTQQAVQPAVKQRSTRNGSRGTVGSFLMPQPNSSVAHYAILDHTDGQEKEWGDEMHSIALDLWQLKEPKVLISVTGGAQDFAMSRVDNDKLMQGLMHVAVETRVWFVTGGTKAGVMKLVGDARRQYAADAPLIGVAAWSVLWGNGAMEAHGNKICGDTLLPYEEKVLALANKTKKQWVQLDSGHSHFFLIKGVKEDFGEEIGSRSAFESRVSRGGWEAHLAGKLSDAISNHKKWKDERSAPPSSSDESQGTVPPAPPLARVPVVLVCVQGGPGTVSTVRSAAVSAKTPVLIVKGSGKAADIIADMISFYSEEDQPQELSLRQQGLHDFLKKYNRNRAEEIKKLCWPDKEFISKHPSGTELKNILTDYWGKTATKQDVAVTRPLPAKWAWLLCYSFLCCWTGTRVCVWSGECMTWTVMIAILTKTVGSSFVQQAFLEAMDAAQNELCKVFDLKGEETFADSLLDCIFHGINVADPAESPASVLERKLKLAVEFNNLNVLSKEVTSCKAGADGDDTVQAMGVALHIALCKRDRPKIVDFLVNHGAKVDGYDMNIKERQDNEKRWIELANTVPINILGESLTKFLKEGGGDFKDLFETRVKDIVGEGFEYRMGAISPEFDLMVMASLRNDRDLAAVWWKEYHHPVRAALSIVMLYRNLAKTPDIIPHDKAKMRESADFFEELATKVQTFSMDEDYMLGISNLESPMNIWSGNTLVDIAVRSESEIFLANCCREAIDRRFAGDLRAYDQSWQTIGVKLGLKWNVLINLCFLGVFAPWLMKFEKFPLAFNLRYPTQRLPVPEAFRGCPERTYLYDSEATVDRGLLADLVNKEMNNLTWWQKFKIFWQAPVTLFLAGAMQKLFLVIAFTWWLFSTPDSTRVEPFYLSYDISPEFDRGMSLGWPVFPFEVGAFVLFMSNVISESAQFFISGFSYWKDFWNFLDAFSSFFFFTGFGMRFACSNGSGTLLRDWCVNPLHWDQAESVRVDGMWVFMYSIAVFLLWLRMLRLLSVSHRLGPFVILVIRMGWDISMFAVVYAIFLAAFSVLIRGAMPFNYITCTGEEEEDKYKCWTMWWIVRTFIQASGGEIYIDDMITDAALVCYMILWVVMNLLLLNLVIAIMSSTYERVKEKAEKVFLFDLYDITNEFARRSVATPWPTNVLFLLIDVGAFIGHGTQKLQLIWGKSQSLFTRFDLFIRRNMAIGDLYNHKIREAKLTGIELKDKNGKKIEIAEVEKKLDDTDWKLVERDVEVEQFWEMKMASFIERARNKFLEDQNGQWDELKKTWNLRFADQDETPKKEAEPSPSARTGLNRRANQGVPVTVARSEGGSVQHSPPFFPHPHPHADFSYLHPPFPSYSAPYGSNGHAYAH